MASKKKLLQAAAGSAGGAGLDVDEVFSTYLYTGTGDGSTGAQDITTGIDLANNEGMLWLYGRSSGTAPTIFDTIRGANVRLRTDRTAASGSVSDMMDSFNSDGFRVGDGTTFNNNTATYVGFTFKSEPKFFDVVTYTGDGNDGRTISHNLGSTPGMIIVARRDSTNYWRTWHRSQTGKYANLYDTVAFASDSASNGVFNNYSGNDSTFTAGININASGGTYVAYLFAHNNGDGEFGPDSDQDIIKCGSYTGTGSEVDINLGFEPQWILTRRADDPDDWYMVDTMRGIVTSGNDVYLRANLSSAEGTGVDIFDVTSTGFKTKVSARHTSGGTYIYMAIRRGPLAEPTSATDVFAIDTRSVFSGNVGSWSSGFVTDFALKKRNSLSGDWQAAPRLTPEKYLITNSTAAESTDGNNEWDFMDGYGDATSALSDQYSWMWKRAPGYFDVVCYTGTGSATTVSHNLGVAPEMMWVKPRETGLASSDWWVFHKDLSTPADDSLNLNTTGAENTGNGALLWNSTMPTSSVFSLGSYNGINQSGRAFIAYLFATVAGVSKVGYWNPPSSGDLNVDCGFSNGAKLVIIKRTDFSSSWWLWDSTRGIVAGNDPYLLLHSNSAESSNYDAIDPYSAGFTIPSSAFGSIFSSGTSAKYIFYAIAA